jgi:methyl-accepting chemotaxis protein
MFTSIKAKLFTLAAFGFLAVALSASLSYFIAVRQVKAIMRTDVSAVADALEKTISYIATTKPDAKDDAAFKQAIYDVKIGRSGYAFMLDKDGTLVVHSKDEGKNLAGQAHIDHIRTHPDNGMYEYTAKTTGQDKIVAYRYIRPWGLWIVPGVNKADYFDELRANFLKWNLTCSAVILLLLSGASYLIIRGISGPIRTAAEVATRLSEGDLTMELAPAGPLAKGDELAALTHAQGAMVAGLSTMVGRVSGSAGELSGISRAISGSAGAVTEAAANQSAAVGEASEAVDAMLSSVWEVSQGVDTLSAAAAETSSSSLEMRSSVEEVALNMEKLGGAVDEVSSSITEMSASVKQIALGVQGLADISATTGSSVAEMDASIKQVERNAGSTARIAREVLEEAEAGRESVQATISGIEAMQRSSRATAEVIEALSASAAGIGAILDVIDGVTSRTNLLALNAAIIAAQAGEHGKGFSVVAVEIKQLAEKTKGSTGEIAKVIEDVLEKTASAVKTIHEAESSIASGAVLSQKSGRALDRIVERVKISADQTTQIAGATLEQAQGGEVIRRAMEDLTEMVVQIRNATREQERAGALIVAAVERMKEASRQVSVSAQEHNSASKEIAHANESINAMVDKIKGACSEQIRCGGKISEAMTNIRSSADSYLHSTQGLNEAVEGLSAQVEVLQQEMGGFRTKPAGNTADNE